MKLHILTAVTRPRNVPKLARSLLAWGEADFIWHLRYDLGSQHVGGQAVKNAMLDSIVDGWVWVLDDDTLAHQRLWQAIAKLDPKRHDAMIVSQLHEEYGVLHAAPENVGVSSIDIGQAILKRELIGEQRIPESYAGDGEFLEAVLAGTDRVVYLDEVLSFHNAL